MPRALGLAKIWRGCLVVLIVGGVVGRFSCNLGLEVGGLFGRWPRASGLSAGGVPGLLM
jgi:hypothetical protein